MSSSVDELFKRANADELAKNELFALHRDRLTAMVRLRLNTRVRKRVDESDIVQEAMLEASQKFSDYNAAPRLPFYLWLRHLTGLKLAEAHVRHLGTQKRDARREVPLHELQMPEANSGVLAGALADSLSTPSQAILKAELHQRIQQELDAMEPIDREILVLIHFEQLSTTEAAQVIGMSTAGASGRYWRALKRLRAVLQLKDGFSDIKHSELRS